MGHDVFISYSHKLKVVVDKMVSSLEQNGISCWYAPRDVVGDYATSIVEAIEKTKIFIVILDGESSNSPHVLNEVEIAYKRIVEQDANLTIMPFKINDESLSKAMEYYVRRMHWIDASLTSVETAIEELIVKVKTIISPSEQSTKIDESKREANFSYTTTNEYEFARLRLQQKFLHEFDGDIFKNCLANTNDAKILDVGCGDGGYISEIVDSLANVKKALGIDYNPNAIEKAKEIVKNDLFSFEVVDIEDANFEQNLRKILDKIEIESFDLINVSMVLMHLKYPEKVLKILRRFLKPNGYIVIKDIDDGLKLAYPDPDGLFEKCRLLSINNKFSGFRFSGRQIPYFLHKTGYKDIKIQKCLIDTIGKDYDEKEGLFDFAIAYIKEDYKDLCKYYPDNNSYKEAYDWMNTNIDKMRNQFMEDGFYFSLGEMLFVAKR